MIKKDIDFLCNQFDEIFTSKQPKNDIFQKFISLLKDYIREVMNTKELKPKIMDFKPMFN